MSSSRQVRLPVLALLAMALSTAEAADKQSTASQDGGTRVSMPEFLANLVAGKCGDPTCAGCNPTPAAQPTDSASAAPQADQQATPAPDASLSHDDRAGQAEPKPLLVYGGVSPSARRAVGLTRADAGAAARLKVAAATFISGLEDIRDSMEGGSADRLTVEGHIGAAARASAWAVSLLPKQAA